jgi:enoyl-[acyl-carrier protein] reductase II
MTRITQLFNIKHPVVQAGMVWCSGWRLASAVSNAGGLGLIGSGSMHPELLEEHIHKCRQATKHPFGVNVPLLYPEIDKLMQVIVEGGVKIVFTSAGNPKTWTSFLKDKGITVVHVVSSVKFAIKSQEAGVDAVVAEGFEAGGHNGREETTTFCLVPAVKAAVNIPVLAAGGIGDGRGILGAFALGADGVQIGSRFAVSHESSAHDNFKNKIIESAEGDTVLTLKQLAPVRLIKNAFYNKIQEAESHGADIEELKSILGHKRSKKGIFEGDLAEGELEIGQIAAYIKDVKPAAEILKEIWAEYEKLKKTFCQ